MFGQRPNFGVSTSFGGFGTNTSSTGFGSSSSFGRPVFGTPQTTASTTPFGTGSSTGTSSLFGQTQPTSGGSLFGSQATGFGSGTSSFGSGTGLFGSSNPQTSSSALGGLFGSTTSTSGFNTNQNQTRPFSFGTPTTSSSGTGTGLFGTSSATTGSNLFSSNIAQSPGTVVKFNAVTGTDTMSRSGVSQTIQTKIEVITAMKEYENRSFEELRVEDYLAGRKGPQQQGFAFGSMGQQNKFMTPATSSNWLSQSTPGGGIFGAKPQEKPFFGAGQSTGFGTSTSSGAAGGGGGGLFGSSNPSPFGQATTAPSTGFSFGQSTQNKPTGFSFGQTTSTPSLFGSSTATQSGSGFGSMGFNFSNQNQNQQGGGIFGTQNKSTFGTPSTGTGLFANKPAGTTFGGFGTTSGTVSPFGSTNTNTGGGLFAMNKPGFSTGTSTTGFGSSTSGFGTGGSIFGTNNNSAFSQNIFGTSTSSTGLGGNQANPTPFGTPFGSTGTNQNPGSAFGSNTGFGTNPMGNTMNLNNNVVNDNINNLIKALTHNPFGTSSLLKSAAVPTGKADELLNSPTNSSANNSNPSKTSVSDKTPTYVLPSGSSNSTKPKPLSLKRGSNLSEESKKSLLFAGLDEKGESLSEDPFKVKTFPSVKKLNLKVFKSGKNNINDKNSNTATGQSTTSNSLTNGALLNSGTSPSLTNFATSPGLLESPTNAGSPSPLTGSSPTPDIIKGRSNIKHLQVSNKNYMNDTLADLNIEHKKESAHDPAKVLELDVSESNKENNLSVFDSPNLNELSEPRAVPSSPHPAGIKLTRAGYYTIPSLEDLGEMVDPDGGCLVDNFTIGRYGYGNICFIGITNVAGLDLDSYVYIVRKEVEVYPEGITKPPVGEELNKPALVTLDCVWPVDKSTHELIKSQERLEAMGWPQYLEKKCLKMDATFVEYRPETGSWVFKVRHFSKYGLQDDENEPPITQTTQAGTDSSLVKAPPPPQKEVGPPSMEAGQKTPLSLSNFPATLPLFGSKGSTAQGPPTFGLTSPPLCTEISQLGTPDAAPATIKKKMFLDGSTIDVEEETYSSAARETTCIRPLSPSAERLTLSSRAPPRAIQTLKSQLFFNDFDLEENEERAGGLGRSQEKGQKREFLNRKELTDFLSEKEIEAEPSLTAAFTPEGQPKRLFRGTESKMELISSDDYTKVPSLTKEIPIEKKISYSPSFLEIQPEETELLVGKSLLRDPRSEYELLPSVRDLYYELGRESVSHLEKSIPLKDSLLDRAPKGIIDAAAFMGRSFRVGWGPCLTFVHGGLSMGTSQEPLTSEAEMDPEDESSRPRQFYLFGQEGLRGERDSKALLVKPSITERRVICIEKIHLKNRPTSDERMSVDPVLEAYLQNVLMCSTVCLSPETPSKDASDLRSNEHEEDVVPQDDDHPLSTTSFVSSDHLPCPHFTPKKGINLLHRLALTAGQFEGEGCRYSKADSTSPASVLDLCAALWGRLDFYSESDEDSEYSLMQARKEALSVWLEEVSENTVAMETERAMLNDCEENYLDAVFSHLTARQISKACEVCQTAGDHHLALLISQACLGDEAPRQIMKEQLSNWAWAGTDAFMSAQRLALYCLVAGKAIHDSSQGKINTCLGLDWRRCFAILMWYICPTTSSISEIMKEYEKAAGISNNCNDAAFCQEPKPEYLSAEVSPENIRVNNDVCFQLLKLFVDPFHPLDTLLETSGHTPDPVDVTMSWLLWCILQSLDYTLLSSAKAEALHTTMAAYLESIGSWHWAAFVILSMNDEKKRKKDLTELLNRHLLVEGEAGCSDPFYREKEHFILNELRVPEQWMQKAKAIRAKSLHLVDEEAWYLIQAGDYNEAHTMIVEFIAPSAVINEDHDHLMRYLNEFLAKEITARVTDWQNGGGIYLAYLEVIRQVNELRESRQPTASKVEELRPRLMALCLRLNNLKCTTAVHRLCISEMSRMVVSVLRAILSDDPEGIRVLAQQVTSLPLTHECALEELNHITHQYLTSLTITPMDTSSAVS